jgi:hypothetical protein
MERLTFGHGFVPRIGRANHRAIDRALSPPGLFGDEPSEIPWVIVDGAWATPDTPLLTQLRNLGVRVLIDSQTWRFADERTWEINKYASLDHRPSVPLDIDDMDSLADFVEADLAWQRKLGADALLLPGLMPEMDDDSGVRALNVATEVAMTSNFSVGMPIVGYLGAHSRSIEIAAALADDSVAAMLSALYVQISPVNPMSDSVSKLTDVIDAILRIERGDTPVISGHLGALGGVLRSPGVSAADAGLGTGETFDARRLLRSPTKKDEESRGGPVGSRRYVWQILRSLNRKQWDALMSIDVMRAYLDCRLTCCRFRTPQDRTEWAREHSLRTRVSEAADLSGLAPSMRASRQVDVLQAARASMVTVNSSLQGNGFESLPVEHVENQLAALQRIMARHTAA